MGAVLLELATRIQVRCDGCGRRHVDLDVPDGVVVPAAFTCHRCGRQQRQEVRAST